MLLYEIEKEPMIALDYMERQVNNGSKSGFTDIHNTSFETNPFYSNGYQVMKLIPYEKNIVCFGYLNQDNNIIKDADGIFIHPDWFLPENKGEINKLGRVEESLRVIPTSSARTVRVAGYDIYMKLHYPGVLGRVNRKLGFKQLISGIEITSIFGEARRNDEFPDFFEYMPESYGRLFSNEQIEFGYIIREMPKLIKDYYLIPGFSLFSKDRNAIESPQLLVQILEKSSSPLDFFLKDICFRLIDIFFWCVLQEGIIPEMHSQNVMFAFDEKWDVQKIILRDFESIDKDISIRQKLGKHIDFKEYPYKCISINNKDYLKRYSFMFDHKLGEYLLEPLVECTASFLHMNSQEICKIISNYVKEKYRTAISDLFPSNGYWYKYPDIEIDRSKEERPFISMGAAVYR